MQHVTADDAQKIQRATGTMRDAAHSIRYMHAAGSMHMKRHVQQSMRNAQTPACDRCATRYIHCGHWDEFNYLVMELLGLWPHHPHGTALRLNRRETERLVIHSAYSVVLERSALVDRLLTRPIVHGWLEYPRNALHPMLRCERSHWLVCCGHIGRSTCG